MWDIYLCDPLALLLRHAARCEDGQSGKKINFPPRDHSLAGEWNLALSHRGSYDGDTQP